MLKLAKFLKPFLVILLITVLLLFGQAMCDLNLPNFMSDIVNIGIQQSGIEHAAPEVISQKGYQFMNAFMDKAQKQIVEENYELLDKTEENIKKYPLLEMEEIYILKSVNKESYEVLDPIFSEAAYTFMNVIKDMSAMAAGNEMKDQQTETVEEETDWTLGLVLKDVIERNTQKNVTSQDLRELNLEELYKIIPFITNMPEENLESARTFAKETPEQMQKQVGITLTKAFYIETGLDIGKIQSQYILKIGGFMILIALAGRNCNYFGRIFLS